MPRTARAVAHEAAPAVPEGRLVIRSEGGTAKLTTITDGIDGRHAAAVVGMERTAFYTNLRMRALAFTDVETKRLVWSERELRTYRGIAPQETEG